MKPIRESRELDWEGEHMITHHEFKPDGTGMVCRKCGKRHKMADYKAHAERLAEALRAYVIDGDHPDVRYEARDALAQWEAAQ